MPLAILVFMLVVWGWLKNSDPGPTYQVRRGEFIVDIKVDGQVKALESYVIKAPAKIWGNARIVKLVPEGTMVRKGDFLVQFDTAEFQQRLLEARNKLETAKANLASTKANIISQMADLESNIKLESYSLEQSRLQARNAIYESENKRKEIEFNLKKAEISFRQLVEKKKATEKINKATLRQAELEVEQARILVRRAEDDLARLTLTAPAAGLVVYKEVWEGDRMSKLKVGFSPWRSQPLMEIPSHNRMKVSVEVDEVDISRLALDQPVTIRLDALPDTIFTGKVREISSLARKKSNSNKNVFDAEIYLNELDERLKPGMSARCRIIVRKLQNVLSVPLDAVVREGDKTVVYDEDGNAREITTGISNSDFIVVENGLHEGQRVRIKSQPLKEEQLPGKAGKAGGRDRDDNSEIIIIG